MLNNNNEVQQKHIDGMSKVGFDFISTIKKGAESKAVKSAQYLKTGRQIDDEINLLLLAGQGLQGHVILETKDRAIDKSRPVTLVLFIGGRSKCFYTAYVQSTLTGKNKDTESVIPTNADNNRKKTEPIKTGFSLADLVGIVENKTTVKTPEKSPVTTAKNAVKPAKRDTEIDDLKKIVSESLSKLQFVNAYLNELTK